MKPFSLARLRENPNARIETCQQIIGYRFRRTKYLRQALIGVNYTNQRLALVGDRVLDAQLATRWYDDRKQPDPSQWAAIRNSLVNNKNLAEIGVRLRIRDCTFPYCGPGMGMANTMEAIIGAVWLDSNRDFGAVNAVMERLGLTKHPLLRSPKTIFTTNQPRCEIQETQEIQEIQSSRSLPGGFFFGHHMGLLQLLFKHSQSFIIQQPAGQHGNLSPHKPAREAAAERLSIGMWLRLKRIFSAPNIMSKTAQERTAAPVARNHKHDAQEPGPSDTTNPPKRQAPEHVLATSEQRNAEHDVSVLGGPLSRQMSDTDWGRLNTFIWSLRRRRDRRPPSPRQRQLLQRLRAHGQVLQKLPGRSLKNMPNDFPADGVFLRTHCEDPKADRSLALQAMALLRPYDWLCKKHLNSTLHPEEKKKLLVVKKQLVKVFRARLELWLPPSFPQNAHKNQTPPSLPSSGQPSANSSETPESGLPATAAVDSTRVSTAEPCEHKPPHRPGSVLWTTHTAQHKSVDWKQYLGKPASENRPSA